MKLSLKKMQLFWKRKLGKKLEIKKDKYYYQGKCNYILQ